MRTRSHHRALVSDVELHEVAVEEEVIVFILCQNRLLDCFDRRCLGRRRRSPQALVGNLVVHAHKRGGVSMTDNVHEADVHTCERVPPSRGLGKMPRPNESLPREDYRARKTEGPDLEGGVHEGSPSRPQPHLTHASQASLD